MLRNTEITQIEQMNTFLWVNGHLLMANIFLPHRKFETSIQISKMESDSDIFDIIRYFSPFAPSGCSLWSMITVVMDVRANATRSNL